MAEQILRILDGRPTQSFKCHDRGTMATIGRHAAVAQLRGGITLTGVPAWYTWILIHIYSLLGNSNRITTMAHFISRYAWFAYRKAVPIVGDVRPVRKNGDRVEEIAATTDARG